MESPGNVTITATETGFLAATRCPGSCVYVIGQLQVVPFGSLGETPSANGIGTTFN
jgi:hypothetical protein